MLKGIKEIADDLPGGKTLENIAEAVDTLSPEGRQALAKILDGAGDQGRMLDKVDTLIKNAPNREAIIKAMGEAQQALPPRRFKTFISIVASCAMGAAAADGPGTVCDVYSPRAMNAVQKALTRGVAPAKIQRFAARVGEGVESPGRAFEKLADFMDMEPPDVEGLSHVIGDLGHPTLNKVAGVRNALDEAHFLLTSTPDASRRALGVGFERREAIAGLATKSGRVRSRIYDVTIQEGSKRVFVEVKKWRSYPPDPRALAEAFDQFQRDVVFVATQGASDFSTLRWVVSGLPELHRVALARSFVLRVQQAPAVRRALAAAQGVDEARVFGALEAAAAKDLFATRLRR